MLVEGLDEINPYVSVANNPWTERTSNGDRVIVPGYYEDPILLEKIKPGSKTVIAIQTRVSKSGSYPTWFYDSYSLASWVSLNRPDLNAANPVFTPFRAPLTISQIWYIVFRGIVDYPPTEERPNQLRRYVPKTTSEWNARVPPSVQAIFTGNPLVDPRVTERKAPKVNYMTAGRLNTKALQLDLDTRRNRDNVDFGRLMEQKYPDSPRIPSSPSIHSLSSSSMRSPVFSSPAMRSANQRANLDNQQRLMRYHAMASPAGMLQRSASSRELASRDAQRDASAAILSARRLAAQLRRKAEKARKAKKAKAAAPKKTTRKPRRKSTKA